MGDYSSHFLMKTQDAKAYAVEVLGYFNPAEPLEAVEIGDGNINYVFKIWNPQTGRSVVIKQADKLLRSSGRPLDVYRNKIEAEILKIQGQLAPGYLPEVYHYDETMCALSMEDISAYKNLRKELALGHTFDHLAENLSNFLAQTLLPTTDLVLDRAEKKDRVKLFVNKELCDISEDLVFTEPYDDYKGRNIILPENMDFVKRFLYEDEQLKGQVAMLRDRFMNLAQALIHGDLHSGSIFVNQQGMKVIDPEFAFYGPMGYDVGNVIGNLFFAWANRYYTAPQDKDFLRWISQTIGDTLDLFLEKFSEAYDQQVSFSLYKTPLFKANYMDELLADSLGYAGTEMIRRVVGDSKVSEVTSVEPLEQRLPLERSLIQMGISLIKNRYRFEDGQDIVREFSLIIER